MTFIQILESEEHISQTPILRKKKPHKSAYSAEYTFSSSARHCHPFQSIRRQHYMCLSLFNDEWSEEDALISDTEVPSVYLHLKHFRRLVTLRTAPTQTTGSTATSSGLVSLNKHFKRTNSKVHIKQVKYPWCTIFNIDTTCFQWNFIRKLYTLPSRFSLIQ